MTLFRHRDFRRLWIGESVSAVGSQVTLLALPLMAVLVLDASPLDLGLLTAAGLAPWVLFSLIVGVWVDRLPFLRPVLILSDLGRAAVIASVPLVALAGVVGLPQLYLVAFLAGSLTLVFNVAYVSYLPTLIARDRLVDANGKLQASQAAAQIAGPSLAGLLVQVLTAPLALLFDAASFLVSAVCLAAIGRPEARRASTTDGSLWNDLRSGLRFVVHDPLQRASAGAAATLNFFGMGQFAIVVLFATRDLELDPGAIGLAFAVGSVGGLAGAILASSVSSRFGTGRAIRASMCAFPVALALVPLASFVQPGLQAAVVLAVSELVGGVAVSIFDVTLSGLRQAETPQDLMGRASGAMSFLTQSAKPLGALSAGLLAQAIGVEATLWVAAAGGLLVLPWVVLGRFEATESRTPADAPPGGEDASAAGHDVTGMPGAGWAEEHAA
ncbi:MAG: MFS transporter [Syntrophothermus sp.]